jgi:hypothetical protein
MTSYEDLVESLKYDEAPAGLDPWLKALWLDAKGFWDEAHRIVQEQADANSHWIHAYLHRKEGDRFNASYWYDRCGKSMPEYNLREEWEEITRSILKQMQ